MLSPACKSVPEAQPPAIGNGAGGKVRTFGSPGDYAEQPNKPTRQVEPVPTPPTPSEANGVLYGKPTGSSDALRKSDFKK
jgi:hypothetical protein